jgi:hypothetical protein
MNLALREDGDRVLVSFLSKFGQQIWRELEQLGHGNEIICVFEDEQ